MAMKIAEADPNQTAPLIVLTMHDVEQRIERVSWLWPNWIPRGLLTMVAGAPGDGKSALVLAGIVKPLLDRTPFLDGSLPTETGPILWCDTEGSHGITVERMKQWNINSKKLIIPTREVLDVLSIQSDSDLTRLEELVLFEDAKLIVIDSLCNAHKSDENSSQVAHVLQPLAQLVQRLGIAIVVVHHLRKMGNDQRPDRNSPRGSSAIVAAVRSLLIIDRPNPQSEVRRLRVEKTNLCRPPSELGFLIDENGLVPCEVPVEHEKPTRETDAKKFLVDLLKNGPMPATEVMLIGGEEGFFEKTLKRAKKGIARSKRTANGWVWELRPTATGR